MLNESQKASRFPAEESSLPLELELELEVDLRVLQARAYASHSDL